MDNRNKKKLLMDLGSLKTDFAAIKGKFNSSQLVPWIKNYNDLSLVLDSLESDISVIAGILNNNSCNDQDVNILIEPAFEKVNQLFLAIKQGESIRFEHTKNIEKGDK